MSTRGVMVIKLIIPDGYMVGIWYGNIGIGVCKRYGKCSGNGKMG